MQGAALASPPLIIGLGHRKRVGKDAFATFLEEWLSTMGWFVVKQPFALRLKEAAHALFDWAGLKPGLHYDFKPGEREKILPRVGKTPRQLWIELGNAVRSIHPDAWLELWERELVWYLEERAMPGRKVAVIVPDVRFRNEAERIKAMGGKLYRITRSSAPLSNDPAEIDLIGYDGWDDTFGNEGSPADLRDHALRLAGSLTDQF